MKRLWKIALCLALALIALTACSGGEQPNSGSQIYAEATQYLGPVAATETPTEAPQETAAPDSGANGGVSIFDNPYLDEESISPEDALRGKLYRPLRYRRGHGFPAGGGQRFRRGGDGLSLRGRNANPPYAGGSADPYAPPRADL